MASKPARPRPSRTRCDLLGHKWVTRVAQQWVAGVTVVQSWAECVRCGALETAPKPPTR